jgi:integration host factor subunit beta
MTRTELFERLAVRHPQLTVKDAELAVKAILDALSCTLARGCATGWWPCDDWKDRTQ